MNCRRVRELLPRYVDGELSAADVAQVAEHLEACAGCRGRLALHRRVPALLAGLPEPQDAAAGEARLRARMAAALEAEERRQRRRGALDRWGNALGWATASAVALALLLGLAVSSRPLIEQRSGARRMAAPPPMAATQPVATPISPTVRYLSPELGFSVECPVGWMAATSGPGVEAPGWLRLGGAGFASDGYVQGDQALGHYAIEASVLQAPAPTAAEAVQAWLDILDPGYRQAIGQRALTLGGEPAVELTNLPDRSRQVWAVHEGRLYKLRFSPPQASERDAPARAAYDRFLQSFAFVPISQTAVPPTGTPTPAPTPTTPPGPAPTAPAPPTPGLPGPAPAPAVALPPYARPVTSLAVTPDERPVVYAVVAGRLCSSNDRGATWREESMAGLPGDAVLNAVAIDYRHPETQYALTAQGIYRRQGTAAWQKLSDLQATALAVDMVDPNVLWAGVLGKEAGQAVIVRSSDGGRTWLPAGPEVEVSPVGCWASDILVNPNDPTMLWAVVRSNRRDLAPAGVLYRGDRDGHWQRLSLGAFEPAPGYVDSVEVAGIAYDPNANLLFAGSERSYDNAGRILVIRSGNADVADAGAIRWELAKYIALPIEPCYAPGRVRPLAVDARSPRSLYAATDIVWCGDESPLDRYRLLASHDDGATFDTLQMAGLP